MIAFHSLHYPQGHGPTKFKQWLKADAPYQVQLGRLECGLCMWGQREQEARA